MDNDEGLSVPAAADASPPRASPRASPPVSECVVCHSAPPVMLLPVCGHLVLCEECCDALCAADDASGLRACPVCRAPLCPFNINLAELAGEDFAPGMCCFVPLEARLDFLIGMLTSCLEKAEEEAEEEGSADMDADEDAAHACDDTGAMCAALMALSYFADLSQAQRRTALQGGTLEAVCAAMRARPLSPSVQTFGALAVAALAACKDTEEETRADDDAAPLALLLREALASSGALDATLHALRSLAGRGVRTNDVLAAPMHALASMLLVLPAGALPSRQAVALMRLARATRAAHAGTDDNGLQAQHGAIALLAALTASCAPRARAACAPECVAEALAALRDANDVHTAATHAALGLLHTTLADADRPPAPELLVSIVQAGALQQLLAYAQRLSACGCSDCADDNLPMLLHTLCALCAASPDALREALCGGIVPFLADVALEAAAEAPRLACALCELLATCVPPPADDADAAWREARDDAAAAAAEEGMPALVLIQARSATGMLAALLTQQPLRARGGGGGGDARSPVQTLALSLALSTHALAAFAGMLERGAAVEEEEQQGCCAEALVCAMALAEVAHVVYTMIEERLADQLPSGKACAPRNAAHRAVSRVMAAALRAQPALLAEAAADAEDEEGLANDAPSSCARAIAAVLLPAGHNCACGACDATQAAVCPLVPQLAAACCGGSNGGAAALARFFSVFATSEWCSRTPLATLLTACAAQRAKPALRREATRALTALLALQLTAATAAEGAAALRHD
jgi:hypothetical protein